MIIDVTYECRRKIINKYPMDEKRVRTEMKNVIVHDKADPDATFSDKCENCGYGNPGINTTTGHMLVLCKLRRI